jgi:cyclic pyranopterin phosphate synthase
LRISLFYVGALLAAPCVSIDSGAASSAPTEKIYLKPLYKGEIMSFNHFDDQGKAIMVDISAKSPTLRTAIATATVYLKRETLENIVGGTVAKGDVLGVARLAGIASAKKTPDLIPLSHPLALHAVTIDFTTDLEAGTVRVEAMVRAFERTGVEMEAMVSASVAALTIYDMCKGADKGIRIGEVALLFKEGGKSGLYKREGTP